MNSFTLKVIAMIAMLIDHTAATLVTNPAWYEIMRGIGRISYPIFAFLLVEGYFHTRNVYRYIGRLLLFALLSEIPYDLAFYRTMYYPQHQNIFLTLALGLMLVHIITLIDQRFGPADVRSTILMAIVTIAGFVVSTCLHFDYEAAGILMILLFFFFRGRKAIQAVGLLLINGYLFWGSIQILATLSMVFLWFYNGKKGRSMKYFFYAFYPVHLLILFLLEQIS